MKAILARFWRDNSAATALEYGVIAGLTAAMLVLGLTRVGSSVSGSFGVIASQIGDAPSGDQTGSILDIKRADRKTARP
jgi:pilus assembly protein Flp/PilA